MKSFPLYLMRHGAPALTGRMLGHLNSPATAAGIDACIAHARGLEFEHLVSSDLSRAAACAAAIGEAAIDPRWRELDFGAWDGLAAADIDAALLAGFWADPDGNPPPGGERWSALASRVGAAIAALPARPTLVVTHGGPMRAALCGLLGLELAQAWQVQLPYASVLAFDVLEETPRRAMLTGLQT